MSAHDSCDHRQYLDFRTLLSTKEKISAFYQQRAGQLSPSLQLQTQNHTASLWCKAACTLDNRRALSSSSKSHLCLETGSFAISKDASTIWRLSKSFPYNFPWKRWDVLSLQQSVQMVTHEAPTSQFSSIRQLELSQWPLDISSMGEATHPLMATSRARYQKVGV